MRLVAFGCSHTFGQALPDVWGGYDEDSKFEFEHGPSKYAWPQILANKLDIECINNGILGASNKEIWYRILDFKVHKDDIIVILWSFFDRGCIIKGKHIITQFGSWNIVTRKNSTNVVDKAFFKYIHNHYDMILDFYLRANHVQNVLQDKVKLIKHCSSIKLYANISDHINWNKIKFSNMHMKDITELDKHPRALDNSHPGLETHKEFATAIYNEIKDENPEKFN